MPIPHANVGPEAVVYDLFDHDLDWDPVYDAAPAAVGGAAPSPYAPFQGGARGAPPVYSNVGPPPVGRLPVQELPFSPRGVAPAPVAAPAAAGLHASGGAPPRLIPMLEGARQLDRANPQVGRMGIVHMPEWRQRKHLINVGRTLTRARNGLPLDTAQLRELFEGRRARGESPHKVGHATLVGADPALHDQWSNTAMIWVCLPGEGGGVRFFSSVGKNRHIHHSSLAAGASVIGAGEWIVENGGLKAISANSGHYRPDLASLVTCARKLEAARRPDTKVLMWDTLTVQYVHRPLDEFLAEPAGGYKVHRDSPV